MKGLKISIYKGDATEPDKTIRIPLAAAKMMSTLMPEGLRQKMASEGIDLEQILRAAESGGVSGTLAEIEEKGQRIVISSE